MIYLKSIVTILSHLTFITLCLNNGGSYFCQANFFGLLLHHCKCCSVSISSNLIFSYQHIRLFSRSLQCTGYHQLIVIYTNHCFCEYSIDPFMTISYCVTLYKLIQFNHYQKNGYTEKKEHKATHCRNTRACND